MSATDTTNERPTQGNDAPKPPTDGEQAARALRFVVERRFASGWAPFYVVDTERRAKGEAYLFSKHHLKARAQARADALNREEFANPEFRA